VLRTHQQPHTLLILRIDTYSNAGIKYSRSDYVVLSLYS
jgi:hypothetical protein